MFQAFFSIGLERGLVAELGHAMMENRHDPKGDGTVSRTIRNAERLAAAGDDAAAAGPRSAAKAYDVAAFVATFEATEVTPHVARDQ